MMFIERECHYFLFLRHHIYELQTSYKNAETLTCTIAMHILYNCWFANACSLVRTAWALVAARKRYIEGSYITQTRLTNTVNRKVRIVQKQNWGSHNLSYTGIHATSKHVI